MRNNFKELNKRLDEREEEIEKLNNILNEATYYIKQNCILSDMWVDLGFCDFAPTGKITYKSLSQKKVRKLLDILKGSDKE